MMNFPSTFLPRCTSLQSLYVQPQLLGCYPYLPEREGCLQELPEASQGLFLAGQAKAKYGDGGKPAKSEVGSDNTQLSLPIPCVVIGLRQATGKVLDAPEKMMDASEKMLDAPEKVLDALDTTSPEAAARLASYLHAALAANTRRAYQGDLADFINHGGTIPASPEVLARYIAERAELLSPHTLTRRVVGISRAHTSKGLPDPSKSDLVRTLLRGIRRTNASPQRRVSPIVRSDLFTILAHMKGVKGIRDRSLVLLGFAAALRRSELVALDVDDLEFVKEGFIVHLRRSKTDQEAEGRKIAVPYGRSIACPVKATEQWLQHAQISDGAVFRSVCKSGKVKTDRLTAQSVALALKQYAQLAGLDPTKIAGHSLRSGLATSAAQAGVPAHKIQQQTGHSSLEMLTRYIRDSNLFVDNAAGGVL